MTRDYRAGRDADGVMLPSSADLAMLADPHAYRQYIAGALPDPPASPYVPQAIGVALDVVESGTLPVDEVVPRANYTGGADVSKPTPARVPEWVKDPVKWQSMTRAERRALERHHRRQLR